MLQQSANSLGHREEIDWVGRAIIGFGLGLGFSDWKLELGLQQSLLVGPNNQPLFHLGIGLGVRNLRRPNVSGVACYQPSIRLLRNLERRPIFCTLHK